MLPFGKHSQIQRKTQQKTPWIRVYLFIYYYYFFLPIFWDNCFLIPPPKVSKNNWIYTWKNKILNYHNFFVQKVTKFVKKKSLAFCIMKIMIFYRPTHFFYRPTHCYQPVCVCVCSVQCSVRWMRLWEEEEEEGSSLSI